MSEDRIADTENAQAADAARDDERTSHRRRRLFAALTVFVVGSIALVLLELGFRYHGCYYLGTWELLTWCNARTSLGYWELDKVKQWNSAMVSLKPENFHGTPMELVTFQRECPWPRYLFKTDLRLVFDKRHRLRPCPPGAEPFFVSNSHGLRGRDFTARKPAGTCRLICLGGSTTEGPMWNISERQTYPFLLEERLQGDGTGRSVEVINAGLHGYNSSDWLALLQWRLKEWEPDVVILYAAVNDVHWPEWTEDHDVLYGPAGRPQPAAWLEDHSAVFVAVRDWLGGGGRGPVKHAFINSRDLPHLVSFRLRVRELVRTCKTNRVTPVLCTFATILRPGMRIDREKHPMLYSWLMRYYPFTPAEVRTMIDAYNEEICSIAASEGVLLVDAASAIPRTQDYFTDFVHMTPRGNGLLADLVARELKRRRYVPGAVP